MSLSYWRLWLDFHPSYPARPCDAQQRRWVTTRQGLRRSEPSCAANRIQTRNTDRISSPAGPSDVLSLLEQPTNELPFIEPSFIRCQRSGQASECIILQQRSQRSVFLMDDLQIQILLCSFWPADAGFPFNCSHKSSKAVKRRRKKKKFPTIHKRFSSSCDECAGGSRVFPQLLHSFSVGALRLVSAAAASAQGRVKGWLRDDGWW